MNRLIESVSKLTYNHQIQNLLIRNDTYSKTLLMVKKVYIQILNLRKMTFACIAIEGLLMNN
ncbi:hypothetical protein BLOT_013065 [Blomia tropicalis]|nr:hypothetical protein BLOT_013065 [Blomia tropicalis]